MKKQTATTDSYAARETGYSRAKIASMKALRTEDSGTFFLIVQLQKIKGFLRKDREKARLRFRILLRAT